MSEINSDITKLNLAEPELRLPNNMVIVTSNKSPLALTEVPEEMWSELKKCMNIVYFAEK